MDFELSDDEAALADGIRSLCAGRFPLDRLRAAEGGDGLVDLEGWSELAEAGIFSLQRPEASGGIGLGMAASAVVFEELGRALIPGPLLASHLASYLLSGPVDGGSDGAGDGHGLDDSLLDGVAEGKVVVGAVRRPPRTGPAAIVPVLLESLPSLSVLLVLDDDGLAVVDPAELDAVRIVRTLDPLTSLWRVDRLPEGRRIAGAAQARRWRRDQWVLGGALLVGLAAGTLEMAVAYAKQREQFGKPIGSFQAVKHMCADMLVAAETARAAVHAAAVTIDQPGVGDPDRAAAGAGLLASEAAIKNGKTSIQVHGGMGFTWDVPAHLYLMRARVLTEAIGPVADLAELVAELY
ncbi:MAG TPA: acyl-CoA dehydrogenase family protein [Acidimicrobiales bacterium]